MQKRHVHGSRPSGGPENCLMERRENGTCAFAHEPEGSFHGEISQVSRGNIFAIAKNSTVFAACSRKGIPWPCNMGVCTPSPWSRQAKTARFPSRFPKIENKRPNGLQRHGSTKGLFPGMRRCHLFHGNLSLWSRADTVSATALHSNTRRAGGTWKSRIRGIPLSPCGIPCVDGRADQGDGPYMGESGRPDQSSLVFSMVFCHSLPHEVHL